jgi:predicted HTH transcriptional regulator
MSRLFKPLDDWTAADVQALIDERVPEGQRLEYKRQLDLGTPAKNKEAAKDASGGANAQGLTIIYGVDEEEQEDGYRVPVEATPLADGNAQSRLEDVLCSSVVPRLSLASRMLEAPEGGYFLVVRVFQGSGPPHMVDAYSEKAPLGSDRSFDPTDGAA